MPNTSKQKRAANLNLQLFNNHSADRAGFEPTLPLLYRKIHARSFNHEDLSQQ